jgi:hypothetical protein
MIETVHYAASGTSQARERKFAGAIQTGEGKNHASAFPASGGRCRRRKKDWVDMNNALVCELGISGEEYRPW